MWDVADIQWWWRDGGYVDPARQLFLESGDGEARTMLLLSEAYATFDYEVFPGLEAAEAGLKVFDRGLRWLESLLLAQQADSVTFFVREDHSAFRRAAAEQGFEDLQRAYVQLALNMEAEPAGAAGNRSIHVRCIEDSDFIGGNPPVIRTPARDFARILKAPHYRAYQHLVAVGSENRVMGECIYWVDRANGIGVFEPVETRPEYRRRGVARALLMAGLSRMKGQGVKIAKVSHYSDNLAARNLYRSLGFGQVFNRIVYGRQLS